LAFSLASVLNFILLWVALKLKIGSLDEKRIVWAVVKISLATLAMGFVTQLMKYGTEPYFGTRTFLGIFLQGLISGLAGIAVFIVVGLALKSREMSTFIESAKRHLFKDKSNYPKAGIDENVEV